jgi:hypothetical protein
MKSKNSLAIFFLSMFKNWMRWSLKNPPYSGFATTASHGLFGYVAVRSAGAVINLRPKLFSWRCRQCAEDLEYQKEERWSSAKA